MTLPLTTTTVTVRRTTNPGGDPTEAASVVTVAERVPATISAPSGRETATGEAVDAILAVELDALAHLDLVADDGTGELYAVVWTQQVGGLGLDHTKAGLRRG